MTSISHPYKVSSYSDQSSDHKVENIENKNPQKFWATSLASEEAYFEIKFAPLKIYAIEILTSSTPQIEISAFNRDTYGETLEQVTYAPKTDLIPKYDFLNSDGGLKVKKLKPLDEEYMSTTEFTHIRVNLSNPYHREKPVCLGLTSFILYGVPAERKIDKFNTSFSKTENTGNFQNFTMEVESEKHGSNNNSSSLISGLAKKGEYEHRGLGGESHLKKRPPGDQDYDYADLENLTNNFSYNKKVKPNYSNKPDNKSQRSPLVGEDEDAELQRALKESEREARKHQLSGKTSPMIDLTGDVGPGRDPKKFDQDGDDLSYASHGSRKNNGRVDNKANSRRGQNDVDDDFEKAIRMSKESFVMEQMRAEASTEPSEVNVTSLLAPKGGEKSKEEDALQYAKMLDKYADKEEELSAEDNFKFEKPKDEDELTEPLESMMDPEELQEGFENEQMEEEKDMRPNSNSGFSFRRNEEPERSYYQDTNSNNSQRGKYWSYGGRHNYGANNEMYNLTASELSSDYIQAELRAKKKNVKVDYQPQVTTSSEDILKGVVFSLSGFGKTDRDTLRDNAISMGARFRDELFDGFTTHLISNGKNQGKYAAAKNMKHDIIIVNRQWIDTCYSQKKRVDEGYYYI